jgi:uncharacterized membrane protein YdbT with pleckstrin-like domain
MPGRIREPEEGLTEMGYTDSLLASGETIVRKDRQHWFVLAWNARGGVLALIAAIVLVVIRLAVNSSNTILDLVGYLSLVLLVVGLANVLWGWLRYRNEEYVLTNMRVIHSEGVVNKKATDSSLEKINDAILTESVFGRIFGFGDLEILTASESGIDRLRMLKDAKAFKIAMVEAKSSLEHEIARPTTPPLRPTDAPPPA